MSTNNEWVVDPNAPEGQNEHLDVQVIEDDAGAGQPSSPQNQNDPSSPAAEAGADDGEKAVTPASSRDAIAAAYRARRDKQRDDEDGGLTAEQLGLPSDYVDEGDEDPDKQTQKQEQPDAGAAQKAAPSTSEAPKTFEIVVRGNKYAATRDQLIAAAELEPEDSVNVPDHTLVRLAQKMLASQTYLDEAKETARHSKTRQPSVDADTPSAEDDGDHGQDGNKALTPAQIVEAIQFGDPEEGGKALSELIAQGAEQAANRKMAAERVKEVGREMDDTIRSFSENNQDIATNEGATLLMRVYAGQETISILRNAGIVNDDQAKALENNPQLAAISIRQHAQRDTLSRLALKS